MLFELVSQFDPWQLGFHLAFLPFIAKTLIGGAVAKAVGGGSGRTSQSTAPWQPVQKGILSNIDAAQSLIDKNPYAPAPVYGGRLSAGVHPAWQTAISNLGEVPGGQMTPMALQSPAELSQYNYGNARNQINSLYGRMGGYGAASGTIGGQYLKTPEALQAKALSTLARPLEQRFRGAVGDIKGYAAQMGRFGSPAMASQIGQQEDAYARSIADAAAGLAHKDYARERGFQNQLIGQSETLRAQRGLAQAGQLESLAAREAANQMAVQQGNIQNQLGVDQFNIGQQMGAQRFNLDRGDRLHGARQASLMTAAQLQQQLADQQVAQDMQEWQYRDPAMQAYREAQGARTQGMQDITYMDALRRGLGTQTTLQEPVSIPQRLGIAQNILGSAEGFGNTWARRFRRPQPATTGGSFNQWLNAPSNSPMANIFT